MKYILNILIGCVVLSISTPAVTTAQERKSLSVDDCVRIGLENSRQIHSSKMKVEAADAKVGEVNASRLPSLKFTGGYTRLSDVPASAIVTPFLPTPVVLSPSVLNNYVMRLTLQQNIFTGFRTENQAQSAEYTTLAAESELNKDKSDMSYSIRIAYWNLFKNIELKKVYEENVHQVQAHLDDMNNMTRQGMATENDRLKVQVQLSDAEYRRIDATNAVRLAMVNLNNLMGAPLTTIVEPSSGVGTPVTELPDLNQLIDRATTSRSDVQGMEYRVRAGEASVSAARAGWYPQVSLQANYNYNRPNSRIFPTNDKFADTWDIGVNVSFDVWNWNTTKYQSNQAEAQLAQAQDALGQVKDGIALDITQSWITVEQSREKIIVAEKGVQQAEESYRTVNEKFKGGLALNSDVSDAQTALLQAKTNYTTALVDYETAWARLHKAMGEQ